MKFSDKKRKKNKGFKEIFGTHAVRAALNNPNRDNQKLFISESQSSFLNINIKKSVKEINELPNKEMFKLFGNESSHQGIVLITSNLTQPSLEEILSVSNKKEIDVIVMLDQVTDPNNIGSIMRSCALFNCNTIIISKDNAPDITASMAKAASGALEIINYIKVTNLSRAIYQLKQNYYWIYGLDSNINNSNSHLELPKKCVLVIGSEGKGLRELTKKECDGLIAIPMKTNSNFQIESLNVANACSIALYEHFVKNH